MQDTLLNDEVSRVGRNDGERWAALGGLRFFLASIVVFSHLQQCTPDSWQWGVQLWSDSGRFAAVLGFFVISGYSIGASVHRNAVNFYERRVWRIAPVYFAGFLFALLPFVIGGPGLKYPNGLYFEAPSPDAHGILQFVMNALCLQGLLTTPIATYYTSWSLSCEIAYYAAAPYLRRMSDKSIYELIALSLVAFYAHGVIRDKDFAPEIYGWSIIALAWAWLIGFLLHRHSSDPGKWALYAVAFVALGSSSAGNPSVYGSLTLALCAVMLHPRLKFALGEKTRRALLVLGDISYPLYLSHLAVIVFAGLWLHGQMPVYMDYLLYGVALAVAGVIYVGVDLPSRRYACRRARRAAAVAVTAGR